MENDFYQPIQPVDPSSNNKPTGPQTPVYQLIVAAVIGGIIALVIYGFGSRAGSPNVFSSSQLSVQEESATTTAVAKVLPSVVGIVSKENVRTVFGNIVEQQGGGTGFIVSADGLIVTNKHVVSSESAKYSVITSEGQSYDATVVARDPLADFAVVRIQVRNLPVIELGDSEKLVLGQRVIAIGNALGEYQNTVTTGVVSGINRAIVAGDANSSERLEGVLQTDAAINPGNSGGPLLNLSGQVIGINTAIDLQGRQIGFAIPINAIKTPLQDVLTGGQIVRPKLGVRYVLITKDFAALNKMTTTEGALVVKGDAGELAVTPGGPADLAGIKEGDIMVSIGGEKITEKLSLSAILQKHRPGDTVAIEVLREGKKQTMNVKLGTL